MFNKGKENERYIHEQEQQQHKPNQALFSEKRDTDQNQQEPMENDPTAEDD